MWKRISKSYLNTVLGISIIILVIAGFLAMSEDVAMGLVIIGAGVLIILILASTMGMLIEMAFHLEAIENNIKYLNISNSSSSGSVFGNMNLSEISAQGPISGSIKPN